MSYEVDKAYAEHIEALDEKIEALEVQCKFWRQAAEHAVRGWNALEDRIEHASQILCGDIECAPAIVEELDEMLSKPQVVDLGDGRTLRVVEDETPITAKEK